MRRVQDVQLSAAGGSRFREAEKSFFENCCWRVDMLFHYECVRSGLGCLEL